MAGNLLAGDVLAHAVTFGDFMAGIFLAGDFLTRIHILYIILKQCSVILKCNKQINHNQPSH